LPSVFLDPGLAGDERGYVLLLLEAGDEKQTGAVPGAATYNNKTIGEQDWSGKDGLVEGRVAHPHRRASLGRLGEIMK